MLLDIINKFYLTKLKGKIYIPFFVFICFIYISSALLIDTHPVGESDDYMLPTISLTHHLTDDITSEDLEKAHKYYPEHNRYWDGWEKGMHSINRKLPIT